MLDALDCLDRGLEEHSGDISFCIYREDTCLRGKPEAVAIVYLAEIIEVDALLAVAAASANLSAAISGDKLSQRLYS